jgi:hypothetical protein
MPAAKSLKDLLRIRHENREYIDRINGNLGSALGFKRQTGEPVSDVPAVLIFVPRKIDPKWLDTGQVIKKELEGPGGLTCPTDVVEGGKLVETVIWAQNTETGEEDWTSVESLTGGVPLTESQLALRENLRGWTKKVMPGAQLGAFDKSGAGYYGTLGCFAKDKDGYPGLITNHHVADHVGNTLYFPEVNAREIAFVDRVFETISDQARFKGIIDEAKAKYVLDCAFAYLSENLEDAEIEPRLPTLNARGELAYRKLGTPLPLDLDTMGPVGTDVVGVGRTRSFQRGKITAFAYEWADEKSGSTYTDYLIIGEEGTEFSDPGDSGKLIVTRKGLRPVALLWGGWREKLRRGRQENWTYAIDINIVLKKLEAEIMRSV